MKARVQHPFFFCLFFFIVFPALAITITTVSIERYRTDPLIIFSDITKNYNDAPFDLNASSDSPGTISYTIDNTSVATIIDNIATLHAAGTANITANQLISDNYNTGSKTITLTVNKIAPTINSTFSNVSFYTSDTTAGICIQQIIHGISTCVDYSDTFLTLDWPTSNSAGIFSITSSNDIIQWTTEGTPIYNAFSNFYYDQFTLPVDCSNRQAIVSTITMTQAANGNYSEGSTSFTVTLIGDSGDKGAPCGDELPFCINGGLSIGGLCSCVACFVGVRCDANYCL